MYTKRGMVTSLPTDNIFDEKFKGDFMCWLAAIDFARACHNDDDLLECIENIISLSEQKCDVMMKRISLSLKQLVIGKNDYRVMRVEKQIDDLVSMLRQHIENI